MIDTTAIPDLVEAPVLDTVVAAEVTLDVVEAPGSDVLLAIGDPAPEVILVA